MQLERASSESLIILLPPCTYAKNANLNGTNFLLRNVSASYAQ